MTGPWRLGLTGSIGMGKSTTADMFRRRGVPVWDADAVVARLYGPGGAALPAIGGLCPEATRGGLVDRMALKAWIADGPDHLRRLEAAVHPLVRADRLAFVTQAVSESRPLAVFDIPLLFETGTEAELDSVLVVTAPPELQRARVLQRPGMTVADFDRLLARQMPDAEKRRRADHVIPTLTPEDAEDAVAALIEELKEKKHARDCARH